MIQNLIKYVQDMDLVIHGVNNKKKKLISLSNYSLTSQIVIINFSTACLALIFLIFFNFFLISSERNIYNQKKINFEKLDEITNHLSKNAIKRILTFDDNCLGIIRKEEEGTSCNAAIQQNNYKVIIENRPPQLDPTYTQQYIYANFLSATTNVKVIAVNLIKFADTDDIFGGEDDIVISDVFSNNLDDLKKNKNFYALYKQYYFYFFNLIKRFSDQKKLKKQNLKEVENDNITVNKIIKNKSPNSYIYEGKDKNIRIIFGNPILKDGKVYGVVLIDSLLVFNDDEGASQSFLLSNFFLFFISIMFFLSFLFSKSIVAPIKILSKNANLERDKLTINKNLISYPNRNDEIGKLSKDIKSMSSDLKKRIKEIEEFALDVSHELKNPLTALKSSSDLLKTKKINEKDKDLLINNMGIDIDRMNILISDISNYSLTQVEISKEIFEEVEIITLFYKIKNLLNNKNFILEIETEQKEIFLKVNKSKFLQVINNLIDNSLTFIPANSKILISIMIKNKFCIIHFVDQGPGILIKYKNKIFQRFYTDRLRDINSHSGLGLSISRKIIESFGGNINLIKSTYLDFEGACFEIKLPLKDS